MNLVVRLKQRMHFKVVQVVESKPKRGWRTDANSLSYHAFEHSLLVRGRVL